MKNLLFTSTLFLIINFSFAQTTTDLTKAGLKGKVSFISCSEYKLVEKFGEIEKGSFYFKDTYKYDEKGNKIESNFYDADGSLSHKVTSKYDEKRNEIEVNGYYADGSLFYKDTYKYDEKGNKIERNSYYADGSLSHKVTYKYDEKGYMIESNRYNYKGNKGSFDSKDTYKYDEKGNKIESNFYDAEGSLFYKYTYKYEFDKIGNWIKQTTITDGKPTELNERVIEYY
jgi:hypothetical protein